MRCVVNFSGGICSWAAAKRCAERYGAENVTLLFADTLIEHEDTYRFLEEAAANVSAPLVRVADGRTPFEVFRDERYLGNTRADPCSKILKRQMLDRWRNENLRCDPLETVLAVGIHWSEMDRYWRVRDRLAPWHCIAPMCEPPFIAVDDMHAWATREGLRRQWLYDIGMPHANCGGGCIKMGQGGWTICYHRNRSTFDRWEREEAALIELLGDVAILRDRRGGQTKPMPLSELRRRIEAHEQIDMFDVGGCGCFSGIEEPA